jgi:hypothetical protein
MKFTSFSPHELSLSHALDGCRIQDQWYYEHHDHSLSLLADLPDLGLAIVGTRHPQRRSLELVEKTISELKDTRIIIVSGFARGIDSHAHEMAIQYGLPTLAILGCGIDQNYPKENRRLRDRILDSGGMILSPFAPGTPPLPRNFFERNGLIAGLSQAVWVVEAAAVSGTLNTANWATRLNRQLYATPCFPGDHFYQGNEKLLSQRAPDRYPVAEPFFGVHSLASTWTTLLNRDESQDRFQFNPSPQTEIQRWILELKSEWGECQVQALMNHASQKGKTLGQFYQEFESELAAGLIKHDSSGRVEVNL